MDEGTLALFFSLSRLSFLSFFSLLILRVQYWMFRNYLVSILCV